jgi:ribonuclease R
MPQTDDLQQAILDLINKAGNGGMRRPDMRRALDCRKGNRHQAFKEAFRELMDAGRVVRKRGGRYVVAREQGLLPGTISVNVNGGYGFFTPDAAAEGATDFFVPPKYLGDALSGDKVLVRVLETTERGTTASVERVVSRSSETIVGCLDEDGNHYVIRPMQKTLPERLFLAADDEQLGKAAPGDWIMARLLPPDQSTDGHAAEFVRRIASGADLRGDLDAVVAEFNLPDPYTAAQQEAAKDIKPREIEREDCRHLAVVTIDPEDAKDFDDGLSFERGPKPGRVTIGVHIADVAAFVAPGSELAAEAAKRGFTAYLPGRTLPMLPRVLAADRCSLIAHRDSNAHSVFLEVDEATGEVLSSRRAHTLIHVRERLSFPQVQALIGDGIGVPQEESATMATLGSLARMAIAMRKHRRQTEQFLEAAVPDIKVLCTEDPPRILGLKRVEPNRSHELVEEFMLAANSAVARELNHKNLPGLYRVHPPPKSDDLVEFGQWVKFVMSGKAPRLHERDQLNSFLARAAHAPLADVIMNAFLRTMSRASYSATPSEHYGLGKDLYSHFTSPIRRYTDLVIHQQLWAMDTGQPTRSLAEVAEVADACTALEVLCDNAYYAACDRLKLRYLRELEEREPGRCHEAVVARVANDGLLLYIPELGLQGFLQASLLRGQNYRRGRDAMSLQAGGSGKSHKCGDFMQVQIRHADPVRGELSLQPLQVKPPFGQR